MCAVFPFHNILDEFAVAEIGRDNRVRITERVVLKRRQSRFRYATSNEQHAVNCKETQQFLLRVVDDPFVFECERHRSLPIRPDRLSRFPQNLLLSTLPGGGQTMKPEPRGMPNAFEDGAIRSRRAGQWRTGTTSSDVGGS